MHTTLVRRTHLHMYDAQVTCLNACKLFAENAHAPMHACLCNGAETSLPSKLLQTYFEFCASIVQTVVCRPPCCCLDETRRPTVSAQGMFKFAPAHDAVAAAVSDKHHSIICVSAGLIQFVYGLHSARDHGAHFTGLHFIKNSIHGIFLIVLKRLQMC